MILFFEQFKKCREKTQKLEPKSCKIFGLDFFWEWKKTKKLQKCNFATLQLFGLIAFYYCFLIKKGKKQQKLQSCKVAFLQLFVFFPKISGPKNSGFLWDFFLNLRSLDSRNLIPIFLGLGSQQFLCQKPYPYFLGWVSISTVFIS